MTRAQHPPIPCVEIMSPAPMLSSLFATAVMMIPTTITLLNFGCCCCDDDIETLLTNCTVLWKCLRFRLVLRTCIISLLTNVLNQQQTNTGNHRLGWKSNDEDRNNVTCQLTCTIDALLLSQFLPYDLVCRRLIADITEN